MTFRAGTGDPPVREPETPREPPVEEPGPEPLPEVDPEPRPPEIDPIPGQPPVRMAPWLRAGTRSRGLDARRQPQTHRNDRTAH